MFLFRILALSDIHGNVKAVNRLLSYIIKNNIKVDVISITGDLPLTTPPLLMLRYMITHPSNALHKPKYTRWVYHGEGRTKFIEYQIKSVKNILSLLSGLNIPIIYIPGNTDTIEAQEVIKSWSDSEVHFLDCNTKIIDSIQFYGCGGSKLYSKEYFEPLCDMEFLPEDFRSRFNNLFELLKTKNDEVISILLTHESPSFSIQNSTIQVNGGSNVIKELITKLKPQVTIFGHYHEYSVSKKVKDTIYLNPGPLACYRFALIDIIDNSINVYVKKLPSSKLDFTNIIYRYRIDHDCTLRFD